METMDKKPEPHKIQTPTLPNTPEFRNFAELAGKLLRVPKAELDALEAERKAEKPTPRKRSQAT